MTSFQLEEFFASVAEPKERVRTSEDVVVSKVGRELYEKFFRNYISTLEIKFFTIMTKFRVTASAVILRRSRLKAQL